MNYFLKKFEKIKNVASIEGYMYPVNFKKNVADYFFLKGTGCWGWATWRRSWKNYESSTQKLLRQLKKKSVYEFDYFNSYPYFKMLKKQKFSKNQSWAIKWYAANFIKNNYTIYFRNSLVKNIGLDGSGVNCKIDYQINQKKFKNKTKKIKGHKKIEENITAKINISEYLNSKFNFKNKLFLLLKSFYYDLVLSKFNF